MHVVEHTVKLLAPSRWQQELDQKMRAPGVRVIVCVLGRRAGKTTCVQRFLRRALASKLNVGWYAHVDSAAEQAWGYAVGVLPQSAFRYRNETKHQFRLQNGSAFTFGSMKEPDNNRGRGHDIVVLDEGAQMSMYARDQVVSAMVAESDVGLIVVFTTPKGKRGKGAWVYRDFKKAEAGEPGYLKIHGRTEDNPLETVHEWAAWVRKNLPEKVVRQELDGEFLEGGLGVLDFRPIAVNGGDARKPMAMPYHEDPIVGLNGKAIVETCSVGLDPARESDFFACAAIGLKSRRLRGLMRFHRMEWPQQTAIATDFWKRYAGGRAAMLDTTGMGGDAVASMLRAKGLRFRPVNFSKKAEVADERFDVDNKTMIVQALQVATEGKHWSIPWIEELISEGETFEAQLLSSGHVRYRAAEGFYDDLVIAVGLAIIGLPQHDGPMVRVGQLRESEVLDPARAAPSALPDMDAGDEDWSGDVTMGREF